MFFNKLFVSAVVFGGIAASSLLNAPVTHAATASCVDGSVKSSLNASIVNHDTISITTKGNVPLCKDVTLYWDSYTMPDTYDGLSFATSKSIAPQTQYSHAVISMKAGATTASATISLPTCKNTQTDLYYGPEIKTVTAAGHGAAFITGEINGYPTSYAGSRAKDLATCQTPVVTAVTPTAPATPAAPSAPVPASTPQAPMAVVTETALPSTGASDYTLVIAALLAAGTFGVTSFLTKKRANA